jgi:hypothetical protein
MPFGGLGPIAGCRAHGLFANYNETVSTPPHIASLRQAVVIVLMALLALAPFLHGHLGASHVRGFHVDGLDVAHSASSQVPQASVSVHGWEEEESPALGVSVSLPQTADDGQWVIGMLGLLWACLAKPMRERRLRLRPEPAGPAPCAYESGWPPPALAPPL